MPKKFDPNQTINSPIDTNIYPDNARTDAKEIEALFDQAPSSPFVDSLWDWWMEKGFLTELQFQKLEEIAERGDSRGRWK